MEKMGPARPEPTSLRVSLINGTGTVWVLYCMVWVWVKGQNVVWVSDTIQYYCCLLLSYD